ncbi:MAG: aminotransferase class V-fold PLP-dependent enzyme, partial [Miltoncostaeaceae bacterium]
MAQVYLDHAAAWPPQDRLLDAMAGAARAMWANPDALHDAALAPAEALEEARERVAALVGADPAWVIFTAGATEARNLAVKGLVAGNPATDGAPGLVVSAVEHPAVLACARTLEAAGVMVRSVGVDQEGRLDAGAVAGALEGGGAVLSLHHAQGDIGTVQDLPVLVAAARSAGPQVRIHIDAGESAGVLPLEMGALGIDALTVDGRSLGAPPWTGALVVREGARLHPQMEGGLQEMGKRAGPECLPGIVALGWAARWAAEEREERAARMTEAGERLITGLLALPGVRLNGPRGGRLPGSVQVSVGDVEGESLCLALAARGVACSPGSACTTAGGKAAPTLEAIGLEPPWSHSAVLLSAGPATTDAEAEAAVRAFGEELARLRAISP